MKIKQYDEKDKSFILEMSQRFTAFDFVSFRVIEIHNKQQKSLSIESIKNNRDNIFISTNQNEYLGYIIILIFKGALIFFYNKKALLDFSRSAFELYI